MALPKLLIVSTLFLPTVSSLASTLHELARAGKYQSIIESLKSSKESEVAKLASQKDSKGLTPLHHVTLYVF